MELLKNLTEKELTSLRETFNSTEENALDIDEFQEVMIEACKRKNIDWKTMKLSELFNDIDINGDNTVSWDEFTDFTIKGATNADRGEGTKDGAIKDYNHVHTVSTEVPGSIVHVEHLPESNLILKVMRTGRFSKIKLCKNTPAMPTYRESPKQPDDTRITCQCVIPNLKDVTCSDVVAVGYTDSVVRFFDIHKKNHNQPNVMVVRKELELSEGQTAMTWSSRYKRLVCGSRSGVVSVVDVDQDTTVGKERLHNLLICDMVVKDTQLYTASVDPEGGVKAVDMENSVVKFALSGHSQGAYKVAINNELQQLYSVGFELEPLVYSLCTPRMTPYKLVDINRPHHKRIVSLEAIPGTPQVITADLTGLVKVWDVRMYNCVQSIATAKEEQGDTGLLSSIGYIAPRNRLLVNGRDTKSYDYDMASAPHLSDDTPCTLAIFNPMSRSFLTVHKISVKLWDSETGILRGHHKAICNMDETIPAVVNDITAVCLALPLGRKFFLGTVKGELYSVGYAVCEVLRKWPDNICSTPVAEREIVALEYLDGFKDNAFPYVMVVFKQEIVLVPDAEEHVQRSFLPLHCFQQVLQHTSAKSATLAAKSRVVCSTANGAVHVADLATFTLLHSVTTDFVGDVISLCHVNFKESKKGTSALCFCADSCQLSAMFISCSADVEVLTQFGKPPPRPQMPSTSPSGAILATPRKQRLSIRVPNEVPTSLGSRPNSAVAGYFTQRQDIIYTNIYTSIVVLERQHLVVTGDEKGKIRIFDVSLLIRHCEKLSDPKVDSASLPDPSRFDIPIVASWDAHESDVLSVKVIDADTDTPKLLTVGDREVITWSLDGVNLGNLSQGRTHYSEPLPGMEKFVFDKPPKEAWSEIEATIADRDEDGHSQRSRSRSFGGTTTSSVHNLPLIGGNSGAGSASQTNLHPMDPFSITGGSEKSAFLTDLTGYTPAHTRSGSAELTNGPTEAQQLAYPTRLNGLVNPMRVDYNSLKPGSLKGKANVLQPRLPQLPMTPRGQSRTLNTINSARAMTDRSHRESQAASANDPSKKKKEFVKFSASTAKYLKSMGVDENPLESEGQRSLRNTGRVVLKPGRNTEAPSSRVL